MKKRNLTGLFVFLLLSIGCTKEVESQYCKNELKLIQPENEVKVLNFKFNSEPDSLLTLIEKKLQTNICDKKTHFGIQVGDLKLKTFVFGECEMTFLHKLPTNDIYFNNKGEVLIQTNYQSFITEIDSLSLWFKQNYPIKEKSHSNVIRLSWVKDMNEKTILNGLKNISEGYLFSANITSMKIFNKELCELSENELKKIISEFPFELELTYISNNKIEK